MKVILVHPDGAIEQTEIAELAQGVGGFVQQVRTLIPHVDAFVNEDGKRLGLPVNLFATKLCAPYLQSGDFVVGTLLLTGPADAEGNTTDVPWGVPEFIAREVL